MTVVTILSVLAFSTILSYIEIPEMLLNKLDKELKWFLTLLLMGTLLVILKALDISLPNPSEWIAYVYSPISEVLKDVLK